MKHIFNCITNIIITSTKKKLIFKPIKTFIKHYFRHGGYKDGVPGLIWCMVHTIHPTMFWLKVLEHGNNKT